MTIFASLKTWCRAFQSQSTTLPAPRLSDGDIRGHIARALSDRLPVTRVPGMRGTSELLVIEPVAGYRIVIGTSVRGKTSVLSNVPSVEQPAS